MPVGPRPDPPDGTVRVALSGTIFGHKWANVFWLDVATAGPATVSDLQDLANEIDTAYGTDVWGIPCNEAVWTQIALEYFHSGGNLSYVKSISHSAGGGPGAVTDASACFVVDYVISASYRGGHPRVYIPGVKSISITNGSAIDATLMTSIVNGVNAFRNALNAFTTTNLTAVTMGTVSFVRAHAWRTPPVFEPYTSVKPGKSSKLGSQRRRILS